MSNKCEHKSTRLWSTKDGGVQRRCKDCKRLQKLQGSDLQGVKKRAD